MAKILVVDDSATDVVTMKKLLEKNGHEVMVAETGEDGVESAKANLPDMILMDIVMPGLNGFQATRQITTTESTKHIPVILISTKNQETDRVWGERQGSKAYFVKPVEEKDLISKIDELLGE